VTQYLLSVHSVEGDTPPTEDQMRKMYADVEVFNEELRTTGAWVFAGGLHPSDTATVVRVSGSDVQMTDGPFAETKEQLGGFWIVEAADLDAALALATKGATACGAPVEVRPFQEMPTDG